MAVVHNFQESLDKANRVADETWWLDVYRRAFPDMATAYSLKKDGWGQRAGIDRVITLESGKTLFVDEKVRDEDWDDFFLEYFSDVERRTPGWIAKDSATDFIAYAFVPSATCYLIPFLPLRAAWRRFGPDWYRQYPSRDAKNDGWVTRGCCVPIRIVQSALQDIMRVEWEADK